MSQNFTTSIQGPDFFTPDSIGDWSGHEQAVCDELNQRLETLMQDRHGISHVGGGQWVIELVGKFPMAVPASGKTIWDGQPPIDFDDICETPELYLSAKLLKKLGLSVPAVYSFNLQNFEDGQFTATRFGPNYAVSGDWVCRANSDAEALELAREAAVDEWAAPDTREPTDFNVEFIEA